MLHLAANKQQK